jgi:alpha-ketoglutarate-dependent taurine dioxygenase
MNITEIKQKITNDGFCHLKNVNQELVDKVILELGKTMYITDIMEKDNGKIINSPAEMFMHTDHPQSHYLAWHCIKQADEGGETLLLNIPEVFNMLSEKHQNALKEIELKLNLEFEDETYPFYKEGNFFYSPSLLLKNYTTDQQLAIAAFKTAMHMVPTQKLRMETGDLFILNNTKFMHGRSNFKANTNRFLKRYLIKDLELA